MIGEVKNLEHRVGRNECASAEAIYRRGDGVIQSQEYEMPLLIYKKVKDSQVH